MPQPIEISPEEAAALLGVHPRTIRNLIKKREIQGQKVSGRWYVDKTSVEAAQARRQHIQTSLASLPSGPTAPSVTKPTPGAVRGLQILAPYRLCCHAFAQFDWSLPMLPEGTAQRLRQLHMTVLEHYGAGFYSYGPEKRSRYIAARSALGSIVGLLEPHRSEPEVSKILTFVELECIGAAASLIRRIERDKQGKRDSPKDPVS